MVSYCILVLSFIYAVLLIILDFHPNLFPAVQLQTVPFSRPCLWSCNCICSNYSPLPLLPAQRDLSILQRRSQFIFCTPYFLQREPIFLSLVFQIGYLYEINGLFLIPVYLILQLLALSLSLDYKTLKIKKNVIFNLHSLHLPAEHL